MRHYQDEDGCCIHCGLDLVDLIGREVPPCPVTDEAGRKATEQHYQRHLADEPGACWDQ